MVLGVSLFVPVTLNTTDRSLIVINFDKLYLSPLVMPTAKLIGMSYPHSALFRIVINTISKVISTTFSWDFSRPTLIINIHTCARAHTHAHIYIKLLSLALNRSEIRDKRPLGRDPDRSWCHRLTSVTLFCSQPMVLTQRQLVPNFTSAVS